ncbi:hypothetical protein EON65_17940 [archaeon]|nr:MAG: hypothetical protein EON65_17940 [archaeon]
MNEKEAKHSHETEGCTWQPEFGAWMVESTPSRPYTGYTSDLARVERNMVLRRRRLLAALKENEISPTVRLFVSKRTHNSTQTCLCDFCWYVCLFIYKFV